MLVHGGEGRFYKGKQSFQDCEGGFMTAKDPFTVVTEASRDTNKASGTGNRLFAIAKDPSQAADGIAAPEILGDCGRLHPLD